MINWQELRRSSKYMLYFLQIFSWSESFWTVPYRLLLRKSFIFYIIKTTFNIHFSSKLAIHLTVIIKMEASFSKKKHFKKFKFSNFDWNILEQVSFFPWTRCTWLFQKILIIIIYRICLHIMITNSWAP